jgi:hypothetical protein
MGSFDTVLYDAAARPGRTAEQRLSAQPEAAAAAAAHIAGLARPNLAVAEMDSGSVRAQRQQHGQGFMPYKWRQHPLPRSAAHQVHPGTGLPSLGKRSASASLAEPLRKRQASG